MLLPCSKTLQWGNVKDKLTNHKGCPKQSITTCVRPCDIPLSPSLLPLSLFSSNSSFFLPFLSGTSYYHLLSLLALLPPLSLSTLPLSSGSVQCTQPYPAECRLSRLVFPESLCDEASNGFPSEPSACWVMLPLLLLCVCVLPLLCDMCGAVTFLVRALLVELSNNKVCVV